MAAESGSKVTQFEADICSFSVDHQTHYDTLGVTKSASSSDIKSSWRKLVLATHPDKNDNANVDDLRRIMEAYSVLSDPDQRKEYDQLLENVLEPKQNYTRIPHCMSPPIVCMKGRSIRVDWSLESEEETQQVENFILELKQDGFAVQQAYEGTSHHVSITGLTVGWIYHFRICAVNPLGAGDFSKWTSFKAEPSSSITEPETHTQEYINKIHLAISTRNVDALDYLLTQASRFDVKSQFSDILDLAWSTANNYPYPYHSNAYFQVNYPGRALQNPHPAPKMTFPIQNCPKSLL